ncbi:MAG: hypothetical protein K1X29_02525 [Bdellovibrionales bacterium]|nr:hypothetical protein [Bdellovibrionales bacterium]
MKKHMIGLLGLMLWAQIVVAQSLVSEQSPLHENVSELDAEVDAEEVETMDQKLLETEARKEADLLVRQAKSLEQQIESLKQESASLSRRTKNQSERYQKARANMQSLQGLTNQTQRQRNQLRRQFDQLTQQVNHLEQKVAQKKSLKLQIAEENRRLTRENTRLLARKKKAESILEKYQGGVKNLRSENNRLGHENMSLTKKVALIEGRSR